MQYCHGQEKKVKEKLDIIQSQGKVREFCVRGQEVSNSLVKINEKSGNLLQIILSDVSV